MKEFGRTVVDEGDVETVLVHQQVEKVLGDLIAEVRTRMENESEQSLQSTRGNPDE